MKRYAFVFVAILMMAGSGACSKETSQSSSQAPASSPPPSSPAATPPASSAPPPAAAPAAAAPAPAPTTAIKTEDTNVAGVVADITECTRKAGVLSLKVRFRNTGTARKSLNFIENRDYEKYYVSAASKKYFILKDSEGTYLTPEALNNGYLSVDLEPSGQYSWWAKYPAPPADVKTVTLYTKLGPPFEDIPVSDQ